VSPFLVLTVAKLEPSVLARSEAERVAVILSAGRCRTTATPQHSSMSLTLRLVALAIGFGGIRNCSCPMVGGALDVVVFLEEPGRVTVHVSSVLVRGRGAFVGFTSSPTVVGRYLCDQRRHRHTFDDTRR
jgi:hypothetical protein